MDSWNSNEWSKLLAFFIINLYTEWEQKKGWMISGCCNGKMNFYLLPIISVRVAWFWKNTHSCYFLIILMSLVRMKCFRSKINHKKHAKCIRKFIVRDKKKYCITMSHPTSTIHFSSPILSRLASDDIAALCKKKLHVCKMRWWRIFSYPCSMHDNLNTYWSYIMQRITWCY